MRVHPRSMYNSAWGKIEWHLLTSGKRARLFGNARLPQKKCSDIKAYTIMIVLFSITFGNIQKKHQNVIWMSDINIHIWIKQCLWHVSQADFTLCFFNELNCSTAQREQKNNFWKEFKSKWTYCGWKIHFFSTAHNTHYIFVLMSNL